jgi:hypothetical protein
MNLARLKQKFPPWADTDWSGIYLEVDEEAVFLAQLGHGETPDGQWISFEQADFDQALLAALTLAKAKMRPAPAIEAQ